MPKRKSRPGAEDNAFKRSTNTMAVPNGSIVPRDIAASISINSPNMNPPYYGGKSNVYTNNRRMGCGSADRFWEECPHPFRPNTSSQSANRPMPKSTSIDRDRTNKQVFIPDQPVLVSEYPSGHIEPPVLSPDDAQSQSEFLLGDLIFVCSEYTQRRANTTHTNVPDIIIDTGASASVCSLSMVTEYFPTALSALTPSKRSFRFGDSRTFSIMGIIYLSNKVALSPTKLLNADTTPSETLDHVWITLKFDVVDATIPCLLSREALFRMNAPINFNNRSIEILNRGRMMFRESKAGHILSPFDIASASGVAQEKSLINVFAAVGSSEDTVLTAEQLTKLHIRLGHAPLTSMTSTLKAAGRTADMTIIEAIIAKCGCYNARSVVGHGIANTHRSPFPGYSVYLDVVYLKERSRHDHPFLSLLDGFSRFVACCPARTIRPAMLISLFSVIGSHFLELPDI